MMCFDTVDVPSDLKPGVETWLKYDKNESTRIEIIDLVRSKNWNELHKRLDTRIAFGTAGLRSKMEAGFSRMNTLTVLQASQGLAQYVAKKFPVNKSVVVGHDHRYNSRDFAKVTIVAFLQLGFKVYDLCSTVNDRNDVFVHTPMVPFAIDQLNASAGIMVTASHNPKLDNGYKVYYANGCQIIPPHDKLIAESIELNLEPWADAWNCEAAIAEAAAKGTLVDAKKTLAKQYMQAIGKNLISTDIPSGKQEPWFVYTPMHGVGFEFFGEQIKDVWGLEESVDYFCVPEQKFPDPAFPTVNFPNPEEKGALDLAIALADSRNISLVLGNDPDADRFSAAVKYQGQWKQLTGNEIGFLFAQHAWDAYGKKSEEFKDNNPLALINSTVSSQMIKKMAEIEGFHYEDTLTGFKWLGNRARDLEKLGYYVPFAYEEAIGFMFSDIVHDKDGISAAIVFLQMLWNWKEQGLSALDVLRRGFDRYGVFQEYNGYYTVPDLALTNTVFSAIRNSYLLELRQFPAQLGQDLTFESFTDLTTGFQSDTPDHVPKLPVDPNSQMITATLRSNRNSSDLVRFTTRGSGTEPKLKVYIEAISTTEERAKSLAKETWNSLKSQWFKPEETGLTTNF
ncbi:LANO_0F14158g1_1 [Lachancea nothofagi CBS 11611]|uniref:phosphopentomutase n=1 Tax=Lachancea nothofagi CBS 11611 TaxID=1266666 RepID=A0A1G4KC83_9SACH|nr:LANO_0F14158g1_1 [Lachancea nothofagi CBS 11611]